MNGSVLSVTFGVALLLLSSAGSVAQDADKAAVKCASKKIKAAGKDCLCVHKLWSKAVATGEVPDFSACEDKLVAAFAKAEEKGGGQCLPGAPAAEVVESIAAAADATLARVGRGDITPAGDACDGLSKDSTYSGGDYSKMPKCVAVPEGATSCGSVASVKKLAAEIARNIKCPGCPEEEDGCVPKVSSLVPEDVEERRGLCCLKADENDPTKSVSFLGRCSLCVSG